MSTMPAPSVKPATTHREQINLLKSRGLTIGDEGFAAKVLQNVNYYRLSAYLLPFRIPGTDNYVAGTSFDRIYNLYEFDRRFRHLIMSVLEPIEILVRAHVSYHLAHANGPLCHEDPTIFKDPALHATFLTEFARVVQKNKNTLVAAHHQKTYGGHFPVWVAIEFFSVGMLSKFYANLRREDQKAIAKGLSLGHEYLRSWLMSLSWLRNCCAHYDRLYYQILVFSPHWPRKCPIRPSRRVFDLLYVMKDLYPDKDAWNSRFVPALRNLLREYAGSISLDHLGFPKNWRRLILR